MDPHDRTTERIRGNTEITVRLAREMRENMTPAEATLWGAIRLRRLGGLRFRAQHPVGPYILHFWCPEIRLVVELDGAVHIGNEVVDAYRAAHLEGYGYTVLRFSNTKVEQELPEVLAEILATAEDLRAQQTRSGAKIPHTRPINPPARTPRPPRIGG